MSDVQLYFTKDYVVNGQKVYKAGEIKIGSENGGRYFMTNALGRMGFDVTDYAKKFIEKSDAEKYAEVIRLVTSYGNKWQSHWKTETFGTVTVGISARAGSYLQQIKDDANAKAKLLAEAERLKGKTVIPPTKTETIDPKTGMIQPIEPEEKMLFGFKRKYVIIGGIAFLVIVGGLITYFGFIKKGK